MKESVKHRLIGAAVLAAVAVLFLPSFFKDRQQYQVDTNTHIPGRPNITAVAFDEPTQPEGIEPALAPEAMFLPDEEQQLSEPLSPPEQPVTDKSVADVETSVSSSPSDSVSNLPLNSKGLPDAWVIQVASLGSQEAANKLRDQLQADGHKAYVRAVPNTAAYRVFIGPKQDKSEALAIKAQLDKRLKVNSMILPFKP
ncbi:SPOR domain-containing protein [Cellvibrio sp. pealriver]|uniref:SPOR domain-containing protein n=1 Tax=Cellvibrio sp. pealriver TaxID=1622269 RepID=UPI00066FE67D|nr:SPOR domain-containing protein [Cellvibrio sp. pealriver]